MRCCEWNKRKGFGKPKLKNEQISALDSRNY